VAGLADPWRADMVAVNGEVLGKKTVFKPSLLKIHTDKLMNEEHKGKYMNVIYG